MVAERGLDDRARLTVEVYSGSAEKSLESIERALQRFAKQLRDTGRDASGIQKVIDQIGTSTRSTTRAVADGSTEWQKLSSGLKEATAAYKRFRQEQAAGTSAGTGALGAPAAGSVGNYSISELRQFIATNDAANASFISAAKERVRINETANGSLREQERLLRQQRNTGAAAEWDRQFQALERTTKASQDYTASLPRLRYALYDVATTANITAAAIVGIGTVAAVSAARYESAFTNVERTLEPGSVAVERLRSELVQLTREIPLSFAEIAQIATLGNQLGIAGQDVVAFSETVARFSAITGVSAEETAKAFGAMQYSLDVPPSEFENLGSAIALVGRMSVATEPEILSLVREIGTQANQAGFAADEVVALAGTLGQLRVPPERARGSLTTYFQTLNSAVASGGDQLEKFATITGATAEELDRMVRSGQGVEVLQRFSEGLGRADDFVEITAALDDLGLSQLRVSDVFQRLSKNADSFNEFLAIGAQGYAEGAEMSRQYEMVLDDLASKWQLFVNELATSGAAVGAQIAPALGTLLDAATKVLVALGDFASSPFGGFVVQATAVIAGLLAGLLSLVGTAALSGATMAALKTAIVEVSAVARAGGLVPWIASLIGVKGASDAATTSTLNLSRAMALLGKATGVLALLGLLAWAITDTRGAMLAWIDVYEWGYETFSKWLFPLRYAAAALYGLVEATGAAGQASFDLFSLIRMIGEPFVDIARFVVDSANGFISWGRTVVTTVVTTARTLLGPVQAILDLFEGLAKGVAQAIRPVLDFANKFGAGFSKGLQQFDAAVTKHGFGALRNWANTLPSMMDPLDELEQALKRSGEAVGDWPGGADLDPDPDDKLGETIAKLRTLTDYAGDLSSVWKRAFDIRFSGQQGLDSITSGWSKIRKEIEDATQAMREHQANIAGLKSDRSIKEYWLTIAEMYGDEKRAAAIRADLAKIDADLAKENKALAAAQAKTNKTLVGGSDAAIANRAEILGLVGDYQGYLEALASSGMSQQELAVKSQQLKQEFINQAMQLGYNRSELWTYAQAFDDVTFAIANVPRNVDIDVDINPALTALRELEARAREAGASAGNAVGNGIGSGIAEGTRRGVGEALYEIQRLAREGQKVGVNNPKYALGSRSRPGGGTFASGGYTGDGPKFAPAGIVHRGEYVMPKAVVRNIGIEGMAHIHRMGLRGRGYANGGPVGRSMPSPRSGGFGGTSVMALDAGTLQALDRIISARMAVYLDGRRISENSAKHYSNSTVLGGA